VIAEERERERERESEEKKVNEFSRSSHTNNCKHHQTDEE
jgi:hypothetical protein